LSIPFALTGAYQKLNIIVSGVAGAISIIFGIALMSDIALDTAIIPF